MCAKHRVDQFVFQNKLHVFKDLMLYACLIGTLFVTTDNDNCTEISDDLIHSYGRNNVNMNE